MDPLSLAANVIAIIGAARSAVQSLKRLKEAHSAPDQVSQLLYEVTDFEKAVVSVGRTVANIAQQPRDPIFNEYLGSLIQRAMSQVTQITKLAEDGWIKDLEQMNSESAKAVWKSWLRSKDVWRMSLNIHMLRQDIAAAMTVLTASEVPHVRSVLRKMVLRNQETSLVLQRTTISMNDRIDSSTNQLSSFSPQLREVEKALQMLPRHAEPQPPHRNLVTNRGGFPIKSSNSLCDMFCMCNCHKSRSFKSPSWANHLIGIIIMSWSGVLGRPICNERRCQRSKSRMLKLDYYFPYWFIQRVISLRHQLMTMESHEVHIRVARVIPFTSAIFLAAEAGNVATAQRLFVEGLASPYDIDPQGKTLLRRAFSRVTTSSFRPEIIDMCTFLLQQSADPRQEDQSSRTPIQTLWSYFLVAPTNPQCQALKAVFDSYMDPMEDLEPFGFTVIHQIVLGLSRIDLIAQLELSTADIDKGCALQRPPLGWATMRGDAKMVKTLLEFNACVYFQDKSGQTVFQYAVFYAAADILEILISAAYTQLGSHEPPHFSVSEIAHSGDQISISRDYSFGVKYAVTSLLNQTDSISCFSPLATCSQYGRHDHARILISHGVALETDIFVSSAGRKHAIPLLLAVQYNHPKVLRLLLDAGASTNVKDGDNMSVLHAAGACSDIETLKLLKEAKLCCLSISEKDAGGRTPLEEFDIGRLEYHAPEDPETRQRCREAFLELLDSVKPPGSDHICTIRGPGTANIEEVETSENSENEPSHQDESDDDSFFEARSTFGNNEASLDEGLQEGSS